MSFKKFPTIFTNKTLFTQVIFVVVIVGSVLVFEKFFGNWPLLDDGEGRKATLLIDFDNMKRRFEGEVVEKMTVLDALNAATNAGKVKLTYFVDSNNNTRIMEINDHLSDGGRQFGFYVNSKKINQNELNKAYIQADDEITIKLE